jgi:hypothetical protein
VEKVMQESIDSIKNDINFFQERLTKYYNEKPNDTNCSLLKLCLHGSKTSLFVVWRYIIFKRKVCLVSYRYRNKLKIYMRFEKINPENTRELESKLKRS